MKALPFRIPKAKSDTVYLQVDDEPRFYDKLHQHDEFQLTLIEEGHGTLIHGAHVGPFAPGDVFLIGGGIPHLFRSEDVRDSKRSLSRSVFFSWKGLIDQLGGLSEYTFLESSFSLGQRGGEAKGKLRDDLSQTFHLIFESQGLKRLHVFLELLATLVSDQNWHPFDTSSVMKLNESQGKRLDAVFDYTLENYDKTISLDEVAEVAHMNISSFCRYFKTHTRRTYVSFLNEYRIRQACRLLLNEDLSVLEVSMEVGFNNLSNFNRQFKKHMDCSPRAYRRTLSLNPQ